MRRASSRGTRTASYAGRTATICSPFPLVRREGTHENDRIHNHMHVFRTPADVDPVEVLGNRDIAELWGKCSEKRAGSREHEAQGNVALQETCITHQYVI